MAIKEPGENGTTVGPIQTPMCSENVSRNNTPGTHKYKDIPSKEGSGGNLIEGPGAACNWETQIHIKGNNTKKY